MTSKSYNMKYIDSEKLIAEIERRIQWCEDCERDGYPDTTSSETTLKSLRSFITSLQQEQKCIFGNVPSEDVCLVCSAACPLRVPKTRVSTSTEIATPSGQADELTFEEYLRGCFEINNGIENDPDNLVRIHAPELLKLARKQEQPMPDSTKLIELWHEAKDMLKEKDFRDDQWRLAYNAFLCGFGRGISVKKQKQPNNMIQWTGNNLKEVIDFTGKSPRFGEWFKSWDDFENYVHSHGDILKLFCEDGSHYEVPIGAWIVKTPDGYNVPSVAKYIQHEQPEVDLEQFISNFFDKKDAENNGRWSEDDIVEAITKAYKLGRTGKED